MRQFILSLKTTQQYRHSDSIFSDMSLIDCHIPFNCNNLLN